MTSSACDFDVLDTDPGVVVLHARNRFLASAWAWVLEHSKTIDRSCGGFSARTTLDREAYRTEVITDLVSNYARYKPERGGASTFIWYRCAAVRRRMVRDIVRVAKTENHLLALHEKCNRFVQPDALVDAQRALERANPIQYAAAMVILGNGDEDRPRRAHLRCVKTLGVDYESA